VTFYPKDVKLNEERYKSAYPKLEDMCVDKKTEMKMFFIYKVNILHKYVKLSGNKYN